ncbi:MAG TPA: DNA mismatch repair protein MutS [Candidatus Latescibacteria bacterium]|nr:DNA mismatch repair protein MutS [Candidatus Latescibacterota bacterium]
MSELTPMLEQYRKVKEQYPDALVLFRMGDFYETFFEDAHVASKVLGIVLTSRNHGKASSVPLAGIPHHALEQYLPKLVRAGYKVAICEQVEDPKKAKGLVRREVVEVVTPGTALSDQLLEAKRSNFLVSVVPGREKYGLCVAEASTGDFKVTELSEEELWEELESIVPSEVLVPEGARELEEALRDRLPGVFLARAEEWKFGYERAVERLCDHFGVASLKGFGCEDLEEGVRAAGAALEYLSENQKGRLGHITGMSRYDRSEHMLLDRNAARNLEVLSSFQGGREGSLLALLDRTRTPMGGRKLREWLCKPLRSVARIEERLDGVEELYDEGRWGKVVRALDEIKDVERITARAACGRANARDLVALRCSLEALPRLMDALEGGRAEILVRCREALGGLEPLAEVLRRAIVDDPPVSLTEGGIIRDGYSPELDELRAISRDGKSWIAELQAREQRRTGISSLKVGYNKVFGYYIEVTKPNLGKVPPDYIRRQTLVNAERFITPELKEYEAKVLSAEERIGELERELFVRLREEVAGWASKLRRAADAVATVDVLASLAQVAREEGYTRPELAEDDLLEVREGRHPVVEKALGKGQFVPNDLRIDTKNEQIWIITGPNMAGKSTFVRQIGIIVLMAQMGSFVPAEYAHIGVVDRIFTRVGASDNLPAGESTFLVEMHEAANILHNATPKSLVLLDEVGRGTSTFDGLSLAWAIVEYLHNEPEVRARTLFATHYHELTELERFLPRVRNYNMAVREDRDGVAFLHKVVPGGCDHSYGIHVAKLAGLPQEVIARAEEVLSNLEAQELDPLRTMKGRMKKSRKVAEVQMDLFRDVQEPRILKELRELNPYEMTPMQALQKIEEWWRRWGDGKT